MRCTLFLGLLDFMLLLSCGYGVGTTETTGGNSGAEGDARTPCHESVEFLESLETVSEKLGFSANELLDSVGRTHQVSMYWDPPENQPKIEAGQDVLSFSIEPNSTSVRAYYYDDSVFSEERENCFVNEFPIRLEVPVILTLRNQDGRLNERIETTLIATERTRAYIELEVELDQLDGTLGESMDLNTLEFFHQPHDVRVGIVLTDHNSRGVIKTSAASMQGPSQQAYPCSSGVLAFWPADSECWYRATAKSTNREAIQSYADRLSGTYQYRRRQPNPWEADNVPVFDAEVQVTLQGNTTCDSGDKGIPFLGGLYHRVGLRFTALDGQIDLTLPGWMRIEPSEVEGQPGHASAAGEIALDVESLNRLAKIEEYKDDFEHIDLSSSGSGNATAGIASIHVHRPAPKPYIRRGTFTVSSAFSQYDFFATDVDSATLTGPQIYIPNDTLRCASHRDLSAVYTTAQLVDTPKE